MRKLLMLCLTSAVAGVVQATSFLPPKLQSVAEKDPAVMAFFRQSLLYVDMKQRQCSLVPGLPTALWGNNQVPTDVWYSISSDKKHLVIVGRFADTRIAHRFTTRDVNCDEALVSHEGYRDQLPLPDATASSQNRSLAGRSDRTPSASRQWFSMDLNGTLCRVSSPPAERMRQLAEAGFKPVLREPSRDVVEVGYYEQANFIYWTYYSSERICQSNLPNKMPIPDRLR